MMLRAGIVGAFLALLMMLAGWLSQFTSGSVGPLVVDRPSDSSSVISAELRGWPARQTMAARRVGQLITHLRACDEDGCANIPSRDEQVVSRIGNPAAMYGTATTEIEWPINCPLRATSTDEGGQVTLRPVGTQASVQGVIAYSVFGVRIEARSPARAAAHLCPVETLN